MKTLLAKISRNKNAKVTGYYLVGNLFNKAIVFLTIPIFTRLMSTSDYGIVNTYMSWVSILSVIVGLSLGSSIRSAYIDFKDDLQSYISSIYFLAICNFIISSTLIILLSYIFIDELDIVLVILCLVQSFMTFIINSMDIKYMMEMNYIRKTLLLALPNIIVVILSVVLLINIGDEKYLGRIIPYVLVTSVVGSFFLIKYFYKGKTFFNRHYWTYAINVSLPLVFHGLSIHVLSTSDRTMLTVFRSASETGIYTLIYSISMMATVVTTSLENVWIPWFTKKLQSGEKNIINKNVKIYIEIVIIFMIVILMIGPEVLVIMAPEEYWGGKYLIPLVLLASFFQFLYSISVDLEYYYKSTKIIATNTLIAAIINILLNFIFIPKYGAVAAAFTTAIAYAISLGIHYVAARKLDNELFPLKIYFNPILFIGIAVFISYLIMDYTVLRWLLVIVGISVYLLTAYKKNRFMDFLK